MHLTLKFLGDTDIGLVEEIGGAIEEIAAVHPPFTMRLERAGAFGGKNPRVLWLGFADSEPLTQLQREIDRAMAQFGFPREQRRFHAHLTLCRIKDSRGAGELVECLKSCGFEPVSFQAKEVIFYKSELKPTGAVYTPLKIVEFKAED